LASKAADALKVIGYMDRLEILAAEIGVRLMRGGRYAELKLTAQEARDL
jgi:hypothetical protein